MEGVGENARVLGDTLPADRQVVKGSGPSEAQHHPRKGGALEAVPLVISKAVVG